MSIWYFNTVPVATVLVAVTPDRLPPPKITVAAFEALPLPEVTTTDDVMFSAFPVIAAVAAFEKVTLEVKSAAPAVARVTTSAPPLLAVTL